MCFSYYWYKCSMRYVLHFNTMTQYIYVCSELYYEDIKTLACVSTTTKNKRKEDGEVKKKYDSIHRWLVYRYVFLAC